jgi:hypothetical protein
MLAAAAWVRMSSRSISWQSDAAGGAKRRWLRGAPEANLGDEMEISSRLAWCVN